MRGRTLRWAVGTGLGLTVVAVGLISTWALAGSRSFQLFGTIVDRVETNDRVLALTFDDGPTPGATDSILGMLADAGVRATFFFTGSELAENTVLQRDTWRPGTTWETTVSAIKEWCSRGAGSSPLKSRRRILCYVRQDNADPFISGPPTARSWWLCPGISARRVG